MARSICRANRVSALLSRGASLDEKMSRGSTPARGCCEAAAARSSTCATAAAASGAYVAPAATAWFASSSSSSSSSTTTPAATAAAAAAPSAAAAPRADSSANSSSVPLRVPGCGACAEASGGPSGCRWPPRHGGRRSAARDCPMGLPCRHHPTCSIAPATSRAPRPPPPPPPPPPAASSHACRSPKPWARPRSHSPTCRTRRAAAATSVASLHLSTTWPAVTTSHTARPLGSPPAHSPATELPPSSPSPPTPRSVSTPKPSRRPCRHPPI